MTVAIDLGTESHTGATGSISEASFSWLHNPTAAPQGVLVFVVNLVSGANIVSSVTYDGVTVPLVSGGEAIDSAGEAGWCGAYFLGSGVPTTDPANVVVNRTNSTDELWAVVVTVVAAAGKDTAVHTAGIVLLQGDGTLAEQSVTDGSPGSSSLRFAGIFSGLAAIPPVGANSSDVQSFDTGNQTARVVVETTAGQGSRSVGFSSGTSDDRAAVHFAIKETGATTHEGAAVLSATAAAAATGQMTANAAAALSATATVAATPDFTVAGAAALSASAALAPVGMVNANASAALAATATVGPAGMVTANASVALAASATVAPSATVEANAAAALPASATVAGDAQLTRTAQAALPASAAIAADGTVQAGAILGEAVLAAAATLAPTGQLTAQAAVALVASANVSPAALVERLAIALLASDAQLAASGLLQVNAAVQLAAAASLTGNGHLLLQAAAALLASASLAAGGDVAPESAPLPDLGAPITTATLGRAGRRPPWSWEREAGFGARLELEQD